MTAADPRGVAPPIPPLPPLRAASDPAELGGLGLTSAPPLEIPLRHEAAAVVFDLDLQGVQAILRRLGYRRLPRSWSALSARAQQRVSVYLAALVSVRAEAYRWSFEEGAVRATLSEGSEED